MWHLFWDMHSGGKQKTQWAKIYVEADTESEAREIFTKYTDRDPDNITCNCCGEDYSVHANEPNLAVATGYHRGCRALETPRNADGRFAPPEDPWFREHYYLEEGEEPKPPYQVSDWPSFSKYIPLEEYIQLPDVLVVFAAETEL